jgi:transcriptional regulator with XRE-family HTH domain
MTALNLNPYSAAKQAGLGPDYVRDILRGRVKNPSSGKLHDLAIALKCTSDYLEGKNEDVGEPPFDFFGRTRLANLAVIDVLQNGFYPQKEKLRGKNRLKVASYAFDKPEWLEYVSESQVGGVIRAGSYVHVIPPSEYKNGLTRFVIIEQHKEAGALRRRRIHDLQFGPYGVELSPNIEPGAPLLTWEDLLSGENYFSAKVTGLVIRAYQFFDGGVGEDDDIPF